MEKTAKVLSFIFHNLMNDLNLQVVAAGANPVLITRGIEKTAKALVSELKLMSKEVTFVQFCCWFQVFVSLSHPILFFFFLGPISFLNNV
jgi:hypothetical protein